METVGGAPVACGPHGGPHRDVPRKDEGRDDEPDDQPRFKVQPDGRPYLQAGHARMADDLPLTCHAATRQRQRSIPALAVELLIAFGRESRSHGATRLEFDRRSRLDVAAYLSGCHVQDLEHKVFRTYAIVADDGAIITVGYRRGSSPCRGRARLHTKEPSPRIDLDSTWFAEPQGWRSPLRLRRSRFSYRRPGSAA